jgi:Dolichyl-phosphate-mannose-protein mannosyltransferase
LASTTAPGGFARLAPPQLRDADGPGPLLLLIAGTLLVALGAALFAVKVTVSALDETLIQQSAVHYASNLPHSLFHDIDARATNRLYSLVLSIAYRITGGPSAVRIDRVLSVLMFVSATFPIFLMARRFLASAWAAVAVALLSVAVPWLTLTTSLFTENLSYPLFWWVLLACCRAVERPSLRRDVTVIVAIGLLIGTRAQFAAVFVGYVICAVAVSVWRAWLPAPARLRSRLARALSVLAKAFPVTLAILLVVLAGLIFARFSGEWHAHVERLLGSYSNVVIRSGLPPNMTEGVLVEILALALGVGLLPALVSIPWFVRSMSRPELRPRWLSLAVCGIVLVVFLAITVYSQGGYLGEVTEERYFFYIVPVFWIGTFAALADGGLRAKELLICAVGLALLFAAIPFLGPLTSETAFLAPIESTVPHVLEQRLSQIGLTGLTVQDALFVLTLLAGGVTALVWRRWPLARARWVVGVAAVVQLLTAGYAYAVIDGSVQGIQGRTGSYPRLGWIDASSGGATVTWLGNVSVAAPLAIEAPEAGLAANQTHVALFWNSHLRNWAEVPGTGAAPVEFPLTALTGQQLSLQPGTAGELAGPAGPAKIAEAVSQNGSPFFQLAATSVAQSPDGFLELVRPDQPVRVRWIASGIQPDGVIAGGVPVHFSAFAESGAAGRPLRIVMTLLDPPPATAGAPPIRTGVSVTLGGHTRQLSISSAPQAFTFTACPGRGTSELDGTIVPTRTIPEATRTLAAEVGNVSVSEAPPSAGRCARAHA